MARCCQGCVLYFGIIHFAFLILLTRLEFPKYFIQYQVGPDIADSSPRDNISQRHPFSRSREGSRNVTTGSGTSCSVPVNGYNVLFIIVDDMRMAPAVYHGESSHSSRDTDKMTSQRHTFTTHPDILTPHLDALASRSLVLVQAHVQFALCGPSRASMLTSRRPDTTRVHGNKQYWRVVGGNFTTIPQYFKQHGYTTVGMGKIFHRGAASNNQDPLSWSEPHYMPSYVDIKLYEPQGAGAGYKAINEEDRAKVPLLVDELTLEKFKERLPELALDFRQENKKFFVGFGLSRPHMNLFCPDECFQRYELEKGGKYLAVEEWQTPPLKRHGSFARAANMSGTMRLPDMELRELRRAYYACISHVDDIVGAVLEELRSNGVENSTIVSFVADHGYHLGENNHLGKATTYDAATHVPMMIYIPGCTDRGQRSKVTVEVLDLFPTLVEAAGLPSLQKCPKDSHSVRVCTQGTSLVPLLTGKTRTYFNDFAITHRSYDRGRTTAYSLRTPKYRLTLGFSRNMEVHKNRQPFILPPELYDLENDPHESVNLAEDPDYSDIRNNLTKILTSEVKSFRSS